MWDEATVTSAEVESLREGKRVGESRLRSRRSEFVGDFVLKIPLVSASVHVV